MSWSVRVSERVRTVPLVLGDTVYAMDAEGDVHAVAADSGELRWSGELSEWPTGVLRATKKVVYAAVKGGVCGLHVTTGELAWQLATGGLRKTPTADQDGCLLIGRNTNEGATLTRVDPSTGTVHWVCNVGNSANTEVVEEVTVSGDAVLVHGLRGACWRVDRLTGELVWRRTYGSEFTTLTAVTVDAGTVFAGNGDGDLVAIDLDDGTVRWGSETLRTDHLARENPDDPVFTHASMRVAPAVVVSPIVVGDRVLTLHRNGWLPCHATGTGRLRWGELLDPPADAIAVSDGLVLAVRDNLVRAYHLDSGEAAWKMRLGLRSAGAPAFRHRTVYFGRGKRLLARPFPGAG